MGLTLGRERIARTGRSEKSFVQTTLSHLALREILDGHPESAAVIGILERVSQLLLACGHMIGQNGVDEVGMGCEVAVDRCRRDTGQPGDLANRDTKSVNRKGGSRNLDDAAAVVLGIASYCPSQFRAQLSQFNCFRTRRYVSVPTIATRDHRHEELSCWQ